MSTYSAEKLLGLWKQAELTVEQAIGHILQNLVLQEQRIARLEKGQPRTTHPAPVQEKEEVTQQQTA